MSIFLANNAWQSNTNYSLGEQIVDGTFIYQVTTPGISGSSSPTFNHPPPATTSDNTVVWTCVSTTSSPIWIVPTDFLVTNTIECIGAGGGGGQASAGIATGGGGGAYVKISNLILTIGASIPYSLGSKASGNNNGGDTWFNGSIFASASVGAKGGSSGNFLNNNSATPILGGLGGQASASIGTLKYSGGNGGAASTAPTTGRATASGGGGAAGLNGPGANGGSSFSPTTSSAASGGGGNGGGSAGGAASSSLTNGGNNFSGSGAGVAPAGDGTDGGGGAGGGVGTFSGCSGGNGIDWNSSYGSGGGGGGSIENTDNGGNYGGGAGGSGGISGGTTGFSGPGIIVITYTPAPPTGIPGAIWIDT